MWKARRREIIEFTMLNRGTLHDEIRKIEVWLEGWGRKNAWLKVVISAASGCGQRVIVGFHKAALDTPSDVGPGLARGIPNLFIEPKKRCGLKEILERKESRGKEIEAVDDLLSRLLLFLVTQDSIGAVGRV